MEQFVTLIAALGEFELELEQRKVAVASHCLFEPFTAFKRIDQQRNGVLDCPALKEFLHDNQIQALDAEIRQLVKVLDADQDGAVTYQDFVTSMLPRDQLELRQKIVLRESYLIKPNMLLPKEIESLLTDFFICILAWSKTIEQARKDCMEQNYYNILNKLFSNHQSVCVRKFYTFLNEITPVGKQCALAAFKMIDTKRRQRITKFDIYQALQLSSGTPIQNLSEISVQKEKSQSFLSTDTKKLLDINKFQTPSAKKLVYLTTASTRVRKTAGTQLHGHHSTFDFS